MTIASDVHVASESRWLPARHCEAAFVIGLAGVFLVNAVVAWLQPSDFTNLVERSAMGRLAPFTAGGWIAVLIGLNDLLLGACLIATVWVRRARAVVLAWAALWLLAVTIIKMSSLEVLGG